MARLIQNLSIGKQWGYKITIGWFSILLIILRNKFKFEFMILKGE